MKARDNPFAADRVEARVRYRPQGFSWPELLDRLATLRYRAAIIGPHGTGKTTLLEDLVPRLGGRGFRCRTVTLRTEARAVPRAAMQRLGPDEMLLLDGAEQLSPLAWQLVRHRARRAGGLLITSHRPGRLPTLLETRPSADLLRDILADLLDPATAERFDAAALLRRHDGNVREVLRELYETAAREEAPTPARVPLVRGVLSRGTSL
ncbi:MAG TPA: hypothetical protein VER17_02000 [Tepidisphaeraceae bacterium]|nr:hypothetical protein [Tepidisphaeraceae bacterium]